MEQDKRRSTINVHPVEENQDQDAAIPDPNVAAFRPHQQQQFCSQQSRYNNHGNCSRVQGSYRGNSNNRPTQNQNQGSNATRNGKFCIYCKILNHTQEECRKRMKVNKPCVNGKGQLYWPKINNIEPNSAQSNSDSNNGVSSFFWGWASWLLSWMLPVSFRNWF